MSARRQTLVIMAKSPRMGTAKTRLAADIGLVHAWRTKRRLDAFTCRVARSGAWQTVLAISPRRDLNAHFGGVWPREMRRIAQGQGDLGARLVAKLRHFARGPVCIIGTDLPQLKRSDLQAAFMALRRHEVVMGPATDGGYYLIGLQGRCASKTALSPVRWSSATTRDDTLATFPLHWRVAFLRELADVDDGASLKALRQSATKRET